ncbi:GTP pyrophosphokinase family protein [Kytococcus sedentarius]|uniref:GTP pyrophosphokinase n=1 Tax=Kytococcus sedentarius TaxID=1276 RepID=UPI0035BC72A8
MANDVPMTSIDLVMALAGDDVEERDPDEVARAIGARLSEFRLRYKFALDEVLTKIDILAEEAEARGTRGPIEHVKHRVKSFDSILHKMNRLGCGPDLDVVAREIRDIAGVRVTCPYIEDTFRLAEMLMGQPDLTVLETKDYISHPKPNGYRSLHLIVTVPVFLAEETLEVPVEIQIRTIAMDFWASVEHQIRYKYHDEVPDDVGETLRESAVTAWELDRQMSGLRQTVRAKESRPRAVAVSPAADVVSEPAAPGDAA